jgi:hypothetical protein
MKIKLHPQSLHKILSFLGKNLQGSLGRRLDGTHKWPERGGEHKITCPCWKRNPTLSAGI